MPLQDVLLTNTAELEASVDLGGDEYYVHIGDGTDDMLRYLSRVDGEDKLYAYIHSTDQSVVCVGARYVNHAEVNFPGDTIREIKSENSVTDEIRELLGADTVIKIPETTRVGVVSKLRSFADVSVVEEPDTIWCVKSDAEQSVLAEIAAGVQHGMARAETVLAQATVDDETVSWEGERLTTDRLRRQIQKALADNGLSDEGNIIVGAGPTCANLHFTGHDTIDPGDTVLIDLGPRGQHGYYGDISRTFVVGDASEWVRETYDIVDEALEAAFDVLENGAGTPVSELYNAMGNIIESYGYEIGLHETRDDSIGLYHGTGHGIGVRIHEKPFQTADSDVHLQAGNVLTVEPGIYDPSTGGVRLEDVVVITEDGYENLMTYPRNMQPSERSFPPDFLPSHPR